VFCRGKVREKKWDGVALCKRRGERIDFFFRIITIRIAAVLL
jgi:hypothetical protein